MENVVKSKHKQSAASATVLAAIDARGVRAAARLIDDGSTPAAGRGPNEHFRELSVVGPKHAPAASSRWVLRLEAWRSTSRRRRWRTCSHVSGSRGRLGCIRGLAEPHQ